MRPRGGVVTLFAGTVACLATALFAAPGTAANPGPTPHPVTTHSVPPKAPKPTSNALSPEAPDPKPPRGGTGPQGEKIGGARLQSRGLVLPAHAPALPDGITAQGWVLFDLDSGAILAARDPHGRYQPASVLKTLTAITLLPRLPGSRVVRASATAAGAEGSHAGLVAGGRYTVDDLFRGLLLVSGNDAADALADAAGGVKRTVALMNRTALSLGAYDTLAQTPSGLDGWQQLTSAYDTALFLRAAMAMPRFVTYARTLSATLPAQKTAQGTFGEVQLWNQNDRFLTTVPGAQVAKTGFTDAAQHTFVGVVSRNHRRLGVAFLRAQRWPTDLWQQASALIDWGFALPAQAKPVGHLDEPVVVQHAEVAAATRDAPDPEFAAAVNSTNLDGVRWLEICLAVGALLLVAGAWTIAWPVRRPL